MIVAVDPGLRACGVSVWDPWGVLYGAAYVKGPKEGRGPSAWASMAAEVREYIDCTPITHLVVEIPQVYQRAHSKGDPNDLIQLAGVAGAIVGRLSGAPNMLGPLPAEWKGQVPKEIHHARVRAALTADELTRVALPSAKSLAHNVWDAVALGLWYVRAKKIRR